MPLSIYLVDDNLTFLTAVNRFLTQLPDVKVMGQSMCGIEALMQIEQAKPDLVLLGLALSDRNGIDLGLTMRSWKQPPHIIILSLYDSAGYVAWAHKLGEVGFVNKADFVNELAVFLEKLTTLPPKGTCK